MPRCKAPDVPRSEAYIWVRRNDAGQGQRRRWAFFSNLAQPPFLSPIVLHFTIALPGSDRRQPQIEFPNIVIIPQPVGGTTHDDLAVFHHMTMIRNAESGPDILFHQEDRHFLISADSLDNL